MLTLVAVGVLMWVALAGGVQPHDEYEEAVARAKPVAQFPFDDQSGASTIADVVGSGNFTAANGGAVLGGEGPFRGAHSGSFGGVASATLPSYPLSGASGFTAEAWVNFAGAPPYGQPVFAFGSSSTSYLALTPSSAAAKHPLSFEIQSGGASAVVATTSKLPSGTWEYVVVTESGGTLKLYLNGAKVAETTGVTLSPASLEGPTGDYLGRSPVSGSPRFQGYLSNVAFYTSALGEKQIIEHYDVAESPVETAPPTIPGSPVEGVSLTASPGSWTGLTPFKFAYAWERCGPSKCEPIEKAATKASYLPVSSDVASTLRVLVTARNAASEPEGVKAVSAQSPTVEGKPANVELPALTGPAQVGQLVAVSAGSWRAFPEAEYGFQWENCTKKACATISEATAQHYRVQPSDLGKTLRATVTAKNVRGETSGVSGVSGTVVAGAPVNVEAPTISGPAEDAASLTAHRGSWAGSETISYIVQWLRCNGAGSECSEAAGGTPETFNLGAGDIGHTFILKVTAKNAVGSTVAMSAHTPVVHAAAPRNAVAPSISGATQDEHTLSAGRGEWSGTPTISYSYQWDRCETTCQEISGATEATYRLGHEDVGKTIKVSVSATNAGGTTTATSSASAAVAASPPAEIHLPSILGVAEDGHTLAAENGSWNGTPLLSFSHQWQRCSAAGTECAPIEGATGSTYGLGASDIGHAIRLLVTAENTAGSASATSPPTPAVTAAPPENSQAPTVTGTAQDGATLSTSNGVWSGTAPISYSYRWERCSGTSCSTIPGATESSYLLGAEDVGDSIRSVVTATNAVDSASSSSPVTAVVVSRPPTSVEAPTIAGTAREGHLLTASSGTWSGTGPITYTYEWQSCDALGEACLAIPGASEASYTPTAGDVGSTLRVFATARNAAGEATASSDPTAVVAGDSESSGPPVNEEPPTISGEPRVGTLLSLSHGAWNGAEPISYDYQWQRCSVPAIGPSVGPDELQGPEGIAVDANGDVWVANTYAGQLIELDPQGHYLRTVGSKGTEPGQLDEPEAVAIGPDGDVWTASFGDHTITEFSPEGAYITRIDTGESTLPYALDVDANGHVWLGEPVHNQVTEFSESGEVIRQWGTQGSEPGQFGFRFPFGIAVSAGHVWLTDSENNRIEEFSESGTFEFAFGEAGTAAGQFEHPGDIAIDPHGNVWVLDHGNGRIEEFTARGELIRAFGAEGFGPGQLFDPNALALAPDGEVWVADGSSRVTRFESSGELPRTECEAIPEATESSYTATTADLGTELQAVVTATNEAGEASATAYTNTTVTAGPEEPPTLVEPPTIGETPVSGEPVGVSNGSWTGTAPIRFSYAWEICDPAGESCSQIAGAEAPTYTPTTTQVGSTLRATVTATNGAGEASSTTEASEPVLAPPDNVEPPLVSGEAEDEQTLTATTGTWEGTPPLTYTYRWQRCNAGGEECADIPGATGASYELAHEDVSHTLRALVTARSGRASATALSVATDAIRPSPPVDVVRPVITGKNEAGQRLSGTTGTWRGTPPLGFSYKWMRCGPEGEECEPVPGAIGAEHELETAEGGDVFRLAVTASNEAGSAQALASFGGTPPLDSTPPVIVGPAEVRHPLTVLNGSWAGTLDLEYSYQWQRCDASAEECVNIPQAAGVEYTPVDDDAGDTLRVVVTATSLEGTSTAVSTATPIVTSQLESLTAPTVVGEPEVGAELTIAGASWGGPTPSILTYQWQRCSTHLLAAEATIDGVVEPECVAIEGAQSASYTVISTDADSRLRAVVTAHAGEEAVSAVSAETRIVGETTPLNTQAPTILGTPNEEGMVTADPGEWTGFGIAYSYQWELCNEQGEACAPAAGEIGPSYEVPRRRLGKTIRVVVGAANDVGSSAVLSSPSAPIRHAATIADRTPPTLSGVAQVGTVMTADQGAWSGAGAINYAYQWQECAGPGTPCTPVSGAVSSTFTPGGTQTGKTLVVTVTATDENSAATETSAESQPVAGAEAPGSASPPTIAGASEEGHQLSADPGSWLSGTSVAYSYQWLACDLTGSGCAPIGGATSSTFTPDRTVLGQTLRVVVSATNSAGSSTATSPASAAVTSTLANVSLPTIALTGTQEPTYRADPGIWTGASSISYSYQWQRCDASGGSCEDIAGATDVTYSLGSQDASGSTVRVMVRAHNSLRSAQLPSAALAPAVPSAGVWVSGRLMPGGALAAQGSALAHGSAGVSFRWRRCDLEGTSCTDIAGATERSYTLRGVDVGHALLVAVSVEGAGPVSSTPVPIAPPQPPASPLEVESNNAALSPSVTLSAPVLDTHGSEPVSEAFAWGRCDAGGEACTAIEGATGRSYVLQAADIGATVRVVETHANSFGERTDASRSSAVVAHAAPAVLAAPTVTWEGDLEPGTVASVSDGSWAGDDPISFSYQWQLCDEGGAECEAVVGATGQSFQLEAGTVGRSLRLVVSAANERGTTSVAVGGGAGFVIATPSGSPASVVAPTISGSAVVGATLTAAPGVWANGPTGTSYAYQWLRCVQASPVLGESPGPFVEGRLCQAINGATAQTYAVQGADLGQTIAVEVTATNSLELKASALSSETIEVRPEPPSVLPRHEPFISHEPIVGETLAVNGGLWSGPSEPPTFQWLRCDEHGGSCEALPGATGTGLLLTPSLLGSTVRVRISVVGEGGEGTTTTEATTPVGDPGTLVNEASPEVSGTTTVGAPLAASSGVWRGGGPIAYSWQWLRCGAEGTGCAPIGGATGSRYTPVGADVSSALEVTVTATNGDGSKSVTSAPSTTVVAAGAPTPVTAPSLPLLLPPTYGQPLFVESGSWTGGPAVVDEWQRCDPTNVDPETKQPRCVTIDDATGPLYTPVAADVGFQLRVKEVASSPAGTASSTTSMSEPVQPAEVRDLGGAYSGTLVAAHKIFAESMVTSTPTLPDQVTYRFTRKAPGGSETSVQSGTDPAYTLTSADVGSEIVITIKTELSALGSGAMVYESTSTVTTGKVEGVLTARGLPTISGAFAAGAQLTAGNGRWAAGHRTVSYVYQWLHCDDGGQNCEPISGATGETYTLPEGDIGTRDRLEVTADDGFDQGSEVSEPTPLIEAATGPANEALPTIEGTPVEGATLHATTGEWASTEPISYAYQWLVCRDPETPCSSIAGAEGPEFTPDPSEVGATIQVEVRAVTGTGSTVAISAATAPVAPGAPPANVAVPRISLLGPASSEAIAVADGGEWANLPPGVTDDELAYQWERCTAVEAGCSPIGGATGETYDAGTADVGERVRVQVTAENGAGRLSAYSKTSVPIVQSTHSARKAIVYVEGENVMLAEPSGGEVRSVLSCAQAGTFSEGCVFLHPSLSPNGQMIAVEVRPKADAPACPAETICPEEDNSATAQVVVANFDGTEARVLASAAGQPVWSPEGTGLLIAHTSEGVAGLTSQLETIELKDPEAPAAIALPEGVSSVQSASFSEGGSRIAYVGKDALSGEWQLYTDGARGGEAIEVSFNGIREPDDPTFMPPAGEGEPEILFSAVDAGEAGSPSYGGATPRSLYVGEINGEHLQRITEPGSDFSSPRLDQDGHTVYATERAPVEGGGLADTLVSASRPGAPVAKVPGTGHGSEASPSGPTSDYEEEEHSGEGPHEEPVAKAAGSNQDSLALEFEPDLWVDKSDGFLPIGEEWMFKLDGVGKDGGNRSELCLAECKKVNYGQTLTTAMPSGRVRYPGESHPAQQELNLTDSIYEWDKKPNFAKKSTPDQEKVDHEYPNAQVSHRHIYYALVHIEKHLALDYWYYYTFNYANGFHGENCQGNTGRRVGRGEYRRESFPCAPTGHDLHQGDWENIAVVLSTRRVGEGSPVPIKFILSQHDHTQTLTPSAARYSDAEHKHVKVISAHGDHANYPICKRHEVFGGGMGYESQPASLTQRVGPVTVTLAKDTVCDELSHRSVRGAPEIGQFEVAPYQTGQPENLESREDTEKFSCWRGKFGDQKGKLIGFKIPDILGGGTIGKTEGVSPASPLRQAEEKYPEDKEKLCLTLRNMDA